ncbi:LOW QUALITY PROTEIN: killin [Oryctolagus cuniculus]|uniref:LOW QUALITY PROTEIN: killin n=1 Tax=Oryctolagus cuniculus TaxID=9986 RepID=UPI00387A4281
MNRPRPASASPGRPVHAGGPGCRPGRGVQDGRKRQPREWAGRGALGGFKRGWKDTRATVGTTFRKGSRVLRVGELSKFPLSKRSSGGKCFASYARGAPAWRGQHPHTLPGCRGTGLGMASGASTGSLSGLAAGQAPPSKHVPPLPCTAALTLLLPTE